MTTDLALYELDDRYAGLAEIECPECHGDERIYDVENGEQPCPRCKGAIGTLVANFLSSVTDAVLPQTLSLAKVVAQLDAEAEMLAAHVASLEARIESRRKRAEAIKAYVKLGMENAGVKKAKDAHVSVWVQDNALAIDVVDEAAVPARFKRATVTMPLADLPPDWIAQARVEVMKTPIMDELKADGCIAPGCEVRRGTHLRIRR